MCDIPVLEKKDKLFDNQNEIFKINKILMKREKLKFLKCNDLILNVLQIRFCAKNFLDKI